LKPDEGVAYYGHVDQRDHTSRLIVAHALDRWQDA
jgi:hypothetical protein